MYDKAMQNGTVEGFIRSLSDLNWLRPLREVNINRQKSASKGRGIQAVVLCRALGLVIGRCSDEALEEHKKTLVDIDSLAAVERTADFMIGWKQDSTLRLVAMSNIVGLSTRIGAVADESKPFVLRILLKFLVDTLPNEIRLDSALGINDLIHEMSLVSEDMIRSLSTEESSRLLSVLSTTASTVVKGSKESILALGDLARRSSKLCSKIVRRRCCILALVRSLSRDDAEIRAVAASSAKAMILESSNMMGLSSAIVTRNISFLLECLIQRSSSEKDQNVLALVIDSLTSYLERTKIDSVDKGKEVLAALFSVAHAKKVDDDLTQLAALRFIKYAHGYIKDDTVTRQIIDICLHPDHNIRCRALGLIHDISFWDPTRASILLDETPLLTTLSILMRGSQDEIIRVVSIGQQLLFEPSNHPLVAGHQAFREAWVALVLDGQSDSVSIDVLLDMVSSEPSHFCSDGPQIMRWMAKLVQKTTGKDLKQRAVSALVRLAKALEDLKLSKMA